jgi:hypothetical protein
VCQGKTTCRQDSRTSLPKLSPGDRSVDWPARDEDN